LSKTGGRSYIDRLIDKNDNTTVACINYRVRRIDVVTGYLSGLAGEEKVLWNACTTTEQK
jgi:hypothetical protein